jgi:hypothetical protein
VPLVIELGESAELLRVTRLAQVFKLDDFAHEPKIVRQIRGDAANNRMHRHVEL